MKRPDIKYADKSVLIIEDFNEFARSLKAMVLTFGCQDIDIVNNGEDAVSACRNKKYDIVLSDYNLGESKDGQQVLEEVLQFKLLKTDTVFLMITAENTTAMVMGALELQPDNYLTKPFTATLLKSRLEKAIIKKSALAPIERLKRKKDWEQAVKKCDEIASDFPKFKMACLNQKLICLEHLNRLDEALELALAINAERPVPWAMLGLGQIYFAKKQYDKAIGVFQDMIVSFPMVLEGYDWLAKLLYQQNKKQEAQDVLQEAISRSPKALERQRMLGKIAQENNDLKTMTRAYRSAVKIGAHSAFSEADEYIHLTESLALQIALSDPKTKARLKSEAEKTFKELNSRFGKDPAAKFRSAVAHANFGEAINDEAMKNKYLESANSFYKKIQENLSANACIDVAKTLKQLGDNALAEDILEDAFEQYFDDPHFVSSASSLTDNQELIDSGTQAQALNQKAIESFRQNDFDTAIDYFSQATQFAANNININLNYAQCLLKRSQVGASAADDLILAEEILSHITRLSPSDPRFARYNELNRITQLMIKNR